MKTDRVRPARISDAPRMAEIEVFNYRLNFYPIFKSDEFYFSILTTAAATEEYAHDGTLIENSFVYDDGAIKGFIRLNGKEIEKLFVEPVLQNNGIGAALLAFAIERMGANELFALEKNKRAIKFYERFGFKLTNEKKPVDDTAEYLVKMKRQI